MEDTPTTEQRVIEIIAERLCRDPEHVSLSSDLDVDLGADSLDRVELGMELEDDFDVVIQDDEINKCITVQDVVTMIVEKTTPPTPNELAS